MSRYLFFLINIDNIFHIKLLACQYVLKNKKEEQICPSIYTISMELLFA